jgi:DNA-binding NtrC family response regulator
MKDRFDELVEHLTEKGFFLEEAVELLEKSLIQRALLGSGGNQSAASKALGIHRNTLQRKMIDYHLDGKNGRRKPPISVKKTTPAPKRKSS